MLESLWKILQAGWSELQWCSPRDSCLASRQSRFRLLKCLTSVSNSKCLGLASVARLASFEPFLLFGFILVFYLGLIYRSMVRIRRFKQSSSWRILRILFFEEYVCILTYSILAYVAYVNTNKEWRCYDQTSPRMASRAQVNNVIFWGKRRTGPRK